MLQIFCVVHIVVYAFASEFVFTDEKEKKTRALLWLCASAMFICLVASMFIPVNI